MSVVLELGSSQRCMWASRLTVGSTSIPETSAKEVSHPGIIIVSGEHPGTSIPASRLDCLRYMYSYLHQSSSLRYVGSFWDYYQAHVTLYSKVKTQ